MSDATDVSSAEPSDSDAPSSDAQTSDAQTSDAQTTKATPRKRRRLLTLVIGLVVLGAVVVGAAVTWTWTGSSGHRYDTVAAAPDAPVAIVFGAQLRPDGTPKPFLAGRLDIAAELYRAGKVKALLVSGDGNGTSGNETSSMTRYLTARGVPADRIVADPNGLDSYDTCARAYQVYGVRRALLVSQAFHLPRAVSLCRHVGIDADGVAGRCDSCRDMTLWRNRIREVPAALKAAADALRDRPPVVISPRDSALDKALSS
ncbi:SanA/YdcF family protein [Cryptosporangium aurantiacum]|uniref:Protein SanA, affects membrane permeability for vancomycin n=1 Tax=Cryptosporangium aurantiacum TaxID=134849 RepID=A0A1M7RMB3_9ACTN|nr:ElyC/SanA/YdcF family protein [Cryptosporangium aurantiacum]SHN47453.1 protein SanA, affects membrane permeability for vancomycin [Cryptosporangium aurantiacum]